MKMKNILFSFKGRISRKQFWFGTLFMIVQSLVLFALLSMTFNVETNSPSTAGLLIILIAFVLNLWESCALYIKRFHDRNKNGWWMLIGLVPFIGGIWLLVECGFLSGSEGDNQFGSMPN
ncbi:DUF805 domain-containing protein [Aliivibrio fischeri]|uniref:DUF805 domain-containing protein n=2 Tax=Aliivibrio fischeri TaxID=668 RepID=A0A844NZ65_ALIFS|nr:DUF805 domain-containing protein [Aliivibrio fischeri]